METVHTKLSSRGLEISGKHQTEYDAVSMSKQGFPSIKEVPIGLLGSLEPPRINFEILKFWIERCSSHHDKCKETWDHTLNRAMRLVHIEERRIVSTSKEPMPYAALSYVWGLIRPSQKTMYSQLTYRKPSKMLWISHGS